MNVKITVLNRSREAEDLHLLPALWFRNPWGGAGRTSCLVAWSARSAEALCGAGQP